MALVDPASRGGTELRVVPDLATAVAHVDRLTPDPATVEQDLSVAYRDGCQVSLEGTDRNADDECWYGDPDGPVHVAVVGDSKMEQWSSALHAIGQAEGWRVKIWTRSGCGFVDEGRTDECHTYNAELSALLGDGEHTPDLLFVSAGAGYRDAEASMARLLRPATDGGARVVVVADTAPQVPRGTPAEVTTYECLDQHRDDWDPCWSDVRPAPGDAALEPLAALLDAPFVDLGRWICPDPERLGGCPPVVGGVVVNRQGSHLSGSYVRSLTPILHHRLVTEGVARGPVGQISWVTPNDPGASSTSR
jgi:hypothetical protein